MAKNSIRDYSATASQNTDINSIDIDENCPASNLNNSQRALMAHLKDVSTGAVNLETPAADRLDVDNIRIDGNTISSTDTNGDITLDPNGTGDTIVASGNVGIGTNAPTTYGDSNTKLAVVTPTSNANDVNIRFGTDNVKGIIFVNDVSGDVVGFGSTTNDGVQFNTNNTQRALITSDGHFLHGKSAKDFGQAGTHLYPDGEVNIVRSGVTLYINRLSSDGTLVSLQQGTTQEGTISVSGTTVSYNGGHLSRWSQLTDGTEDTTIVKGTVMTNLDQMAVWSHDEVLWTADDDLPEGVSVGDVRTAAYTEDNEQLNCMAVSSVEGDANVAGVFVNWDYDDDDFNDMNVAMTGDMVIRIASGTTVARGDLLMSAGDGTAKPQGDDIVRSKTIAKVTSTTVSHTYDDGTYLVPCVLMAC